MQNKKEEELSYIMKRILFNWTLVILWMALIFYFSHQPASQSSELSSGIADLIEETIKKINPNTNYDPVNLNHIIRKGAHFGVYLVLGFFVANCFIATDISKAKGIYLSIMICVLYAISDEVHQIFIPGRSGQVSDVILDSAGGLMGILLLNIIRRKPS